MSDLVRVRGLDRSYRSGGKVLHVLRGLDLDVSRGEMVAVVGDSGVGKSTLLHLLGALDRPGAGTYLFEGREVFEGSTDDLARFRSSKIGFVFQLHHLLSEFTALENVVIAGLIGRLPPSEAKGRAAEFLSDLGVAQRADHLPGQLSGGEQQRVAIARALMTAGGLLLADEPTGNLDEATATKVFELLDKVRRKRGLAVILATHNFRIARACDRILHLREGLLIPTGTCEPPRREMANPTP